MNLRTLFSVLAFVMGLATASEAALEVPSIDGSLKKPFELNSAKAAVLIFYLHDCPICNTYAPEIERIRAEYESKGFTFYIVQTDRDLKVEAAQKHATDYSLKATILLDGTNKLAAACGAKVTPQAAIVGADKKVLYLGRIDDLYSDYGKRRSEPTSRDLRKALDAVAAGKTAPPATGPAVGCIIPTDIKH
jgi:peroxiredoxin